MLCEILFPRPLNKMQQYWKRFGEEHEDKKKCKERCVSYREQLTGLIPFWLEKRQPKGDMKKILRIMSGD